MNERTHTPEAWQQLACNLACLYPFSYAFVLAVVSRTDVEGDRDRARALLDLAGTGMPLPAAPLPELLA